MSIYLEAGGVSNNLKWTDMDEFVNSYNKIVGPALKTPMNSPNFKRATIYGLGAGNANVQFYLQYQPQKVELRANLINGERREMDMRLGMSTMGLDISFPFETRYKFGYFVSGSKLTGKLYSKYVYADNTESFAYDKPLNGIFDFSNSTLNLGLLAMYNFERFDITLRASYVGIKLTDVELAMDDNHEGYSNIWKNEVPVHRIPVDYSKIRDSKTARFGLGDVVSTNVKGWTLGLTCRYHLKVFDK